MPTNRHTWLLCSLFALLALPVQAQSDDFTMMRWRGGAISADLRMGFNLTGGGLGSSIFGGVITPRIQSGAASLFTNPAELGLLRHQQIVIDAQLGIGTQSFGLTGNDLLSASTIQTETDGVLSDLNFPTSATPQYTQVQGLAAGLQGRFPALAVALPVYDRFAVSIGVHYPIATTLDLRMAGLEALLNAQADAGDQTIDIDVLFNIGFSTQLQLNMQSLDFGGGGTVPLSSGTFGYGVTASRYGVTNALNINASPQGSVVLNKTTEYAFNDAGDPNLTGNETNELYWTLQGNFEDVQWGGRAGVFFQSKNKRWALSAVYNHVPDFTLTDPNAFSRSFVPAFINLDGETDPDPADPEAQDLFNIEDLDIAKPNLTRATIDTLGQTVSLAYPSSLTLGVDVGLGKHTLAVNYVQYTGPLAYGYTYNGEKRVGKDLTNGVRVGLDFQFPDKLKGAGWALVPLRLLFLDVDGLLLQALGTHTGYTNPHYRIGAGVSFGSAIVEGLEDGEALRDVLDLPTPTSLSLGRQYTVFERLDVGALVFGFPDIAFKFSFGYTFR
ncbi:MAG: hypothetical protein AAGJ10_08240 [Bacteroidota bacterium]